MTDYFYRRTYFGNIHVGKSYDCRPGGSLSLSLGNIIQVISLSGHERELSLDDLSIKYPYKEPNE